MHIRQIVLIGIPEVQRIGKARTHDLAIAVGDLTAAIGRLDIGDENELVGQPVAFALFARDETFLVGLDRQADDFWWNGEEFFLKLAHKYNRPFNQARHFFEKRIIFDKLETGRECDILCIRQDDFLAAVGVQNDLGLFKLGDVVVKRRTVIGWPSLRNLWP